jgi:hypothetical protein
MYTYLDMNLINKEEFKKELNPLETEYLFKIEQNYVSISQKSKMSSKQDLLNLVYTLLNYGINETSFYCSEEYEECYKDLNKMATEGTEFSFINDLVHPYHKFKQMKISRNNIGKITITLERLYTSEQIDFLEKQSDEIIKELGMDNNKYKEFTERERIKLIHDYLINYAKYSTANDDDKSAYGFLLNKQGNCRGYTEMFTILAHKLDIETVPISNGYHVWNLVKVNNKWYHLDVTWDDPVASDGKDYLIYDFYLIDSKKIQELDTNGDHTYNLELYNENNFLKIE